MFFQLLSEMLAKLEKNASAAIRRAASIEVTALLSVSKPRSCVSGTWSLRRGRVTQHGGRKMPKHRETLKQREKRELDSELSRQLEQTFPASDPPPASCFDKLSMRAF